MGTFLYPPVSVLNGQLWGESREGRPSRRMQGLFGGLSELVYCCLRARVYLLK